MGVVYLGLGRRRRRVAVKVLRAELADSAAFRVRFAREIEAARRLEAAGTARFVAGDAEAVPPWFATEYVPGPTLEAFVAQHGPLRGVVLRAFAVGVADALAAIGEAGLVHRDLKPTNVLLTRDGPTVIDFGVALEGDDTAPFTEVGERTGTVGWMAPEQVRGDRATPATDVFAWGALVAYAANGTPPFGVGDTDAVLRRVVHDEPALTGLDPALAPLVHGALTKEPTARPTIEGVLTRALSAPTDADVERLHHRARAFVSELWPRDVAGAPVILPPLPRSRRRFVVFGAGVATAAAGVSLVVTAPWGGSPRSGRPAHLSTSAPSRVTTTAAPDSTTTSAVSATTTTVDAAADLQLAESSVQRAGYASTSAVGFNGTSQLNVIIGTVPTAAAGAFRAFFFVRAIPVGEFPPASDYTLRGLLVTGIAPEAITLRFNIYNTGDVACCPNGGAVNVRFAWNGSKLVALDPVPPSSVLGPH
jgi:serine/threonine protein kinase